MDYVKEKHLKGLLERNIHAAKGDHGRLLIIGNSERYIGAVALAGLAALRTGIDSVLIAAPAAVARLLNCYSPDLMTMKLPGETLDEKHLKRIGELSLHADAVLLGPGFGVDTAKRSWLEKLIPLLHAPLVLDADGTKQVKLDSLSNALLFANKNEHDIFLKNHNLNPDELNGALTSNVFVVKGKEDTVLTQEKSILVYGGNSGATVAGTGDVLAGVGAALYAQLKNSSQAAQAACLIAKKAAEKAFSINHFSFLASDMVDAIAAVMKDLRMFRITKHDPNPKKNGKK